MASEKQVAMKRFKDHIKKCEIFAKLNDNCETFLDPIMNDLAKSLDAQFGGTSFMDELCR